MMFGLMIAFSGSVSAQSVFEGKVIGATGSQKLKPQAGYLVTLNCHQATSDNAAKGIKSGRKYYLISIFAGPTNKGQQIDITLDITADQSQKPGVTSRATIIKLENPIPEIILGDKVILAGVGSPTGTLTFSRGNKVFGKITIKGFK